MKTSKVSDYPTLGHLFFDENIRVDTIIWLAAQAASPCEKFGEFLDEEDLETIGRTLGLKKEQVEDEDFSRFDSETIFTNIPREKQNGFLVQASTPVPVEFHKSGGHTSYGFGYCRLEWFYTDALDGAFAQRLMDWKTTVIEKARKDLKKKKAKAA